MPRPRLLCFLGLAVLAACPISLKASDTAASRNSSTVTTQTQAPTQESISTARRTAETGPFIHPSGVVNAASFRSGIVAGSWATVFGSNLAAAAKSWDGLVQADGVFPVQIDGVQVKVQGILAALRYVSPQQINFQVPDIEGEGPVSVEVITPLGSAAAVADLRSVSPAFFIDWSQSAVRPYVAANYKDSAVELWGTGFGPAKPRRPAGRVVPPAPLANEVRVFIDGVEVKPDYVGLAGAGLYQINLYIGGMRRGDHEVSVAVNGVYTRGPGYVTVGSPWDY